LQDGFSLCQEGGVDLARLTAVDVHVHVEADHDGRMSLPEDFAASSSAYFGASPHRPTVDEIAAYYRERRIGAVVFTVDIEAFTGHPALSNEQIAEAAARHSDVLVPFASIDPAKGRAGARQLRRLADQARHQAAGAAEDTQGQRGTRAQSRPAPGGRVRR
jgi:uncharacterized protein